LPTFGDVAGCVDKVSHDVKNFSDQVKIVISLAALLPCPAVTARSFSEGQDCVFSIKVRVVNRQNPPSKLVAELIEKILFYFIIFNL